MTTNFLDNPSAGDLQPSPNADLEMADIPAEFADPVVVPIEDYLDLHHFSPQEVKLIVAEYLYQAQLAGFAVVRIIHGKGIGVQREIVHKLLQHSPLVHAFQDAPTTRGGWGATLAYLTPLTSTSSETLSDSN
jgi:dsDNA-specific endonuclease/ATPase MutS2